MNPRSPREAAAQRLARALDQMEQNWIGKTVGIGYECDVDSGRITLTFEPVGDAANVLTITADVADVRTGQGPQN